VTRGENHKVRRMNKRQRAILIDFITVIVITAVAVVAMINFKDWINLSEARRAMEHLGRIVLQYRKDYGSVPPNTYVTNIKKDLKGGVRLVGLQYRALWVDADSTPDEILAYAEKNYHSLFVGDGFLVLRLDGRVEWMGKKEFKTLLAQQQSPEEVRILQQ
jgi:hypothetical protein